MLIPSPLEVLWWLADALFWCAIGLVVLATRLPLVLGLWRIRRQNRRMDRAERALYRAIRRYDRAYGRPPRGRSGSGVPLVQRALGARFGLHCARRVWRV